MSEKPLPSIEEEFSPDGLASKSESELSDMIKDYLARIHVEEGAIGTPHEAPWQKSQVQEMKEKILKLEAEQQRRKQ